MATVRDLITYAMQDLGAIALGEIPVADEANSALNALNLMIETWNTESLMVYNIEEESFAYVGGQREYTMGTGGNFNTTRPVRIVAVNNRTGSGTSQTDFPLYVTTDSTEYSSLVTKNIQSQLPTIVYNNDNFPLTTLSFWPVPADTTYHPVIWSWKQITSFSSLNTSISLPPGYHRALQKNLAIELAPAYGRAVSSELMKQAVESKGQIKRINNTTPKLGFTGAIPGTGSVYALPQFLQGL